jgi:hypothetical protein
MSEYQPRKVRFLRVAVSMVFLTLCLVFVVLWVRCYWLIDTLWGPVTNNGQVAIVSMQGQLFLGTNYTPGYPSWTRQSGYLYSKWRSVWTVLFPRRDAFGFALVVDSNNLGITIPYWLTVFSTSVIAWLPWAHWSRRFSLRTLLMAMTLSAMVLGMAVYGIRN